MNIKKIISFVLVFAMVFSYAPKNLMAANDKVTITFKYEDREEKEIHPEEKVEFDKNAPIDLEKYKETITGYDFKDVKSSSNEILTASDEEGKGLATQEADVTYIYEKSFQKVGTADGKIAVRYHYKEYNGNQQLLDTVTVEYNKGDSIDFSTYAKEIPGYNYVKNHSETFAEATNEDGSMDIYMEYEKSTETTSNRDVNVVFRYYEDGTDTEIAASQSEMHKEGQPLNFSESKKDIAGYQYIPDHPADAKAEYGEDGKQTIRMNYRKTGETRQAKDGEVRILYRYLDADTNKELKKTREAFQKNGEILEVTNFVDEIQGYEYVKDKPIDGKVDGGDSNEQTVEMKYKKVAGSEVDGKDGVEITYIYLDLDTDKEISNAQVSKQKNGDPLEVTKFVKEIPGYEYQKDKPMDIKVEADENNKQTVKMRYKLVDEEAAKKAGKTASVLFQYIDEKDNVLKEERNEFPIGEKLDAEKYIKVIDNYVYDGNTKNLIVEETNNKMIYRYTRKTGTEVVKTKETSNTRKPVSIQKFLPKTGTQRGVAILIVGIVVVVIGTLLMRKKK